MTLLESTVGDLTRARLRPAGRVDARSFVPLREATERDAGQGPVARKWP